MPMVEIRLFLIRLSLTAKRVYCWILTILCIILEDVVAVLHPEKPIIAYNLFWDDDIDYQEDNDPTDHEVVWIEFDREQGQVRGVYTYCHRALLSGEQAIEQANRNSQRARIDVQWGQHGALPLG